MRPLLFSIITLFSSPLLAMFGADASLLILQDAINGALVLSTINDDITQVSKDGLSYKEIEQITLEHSKAASQIKGEYNKWDSDFESIKFMDKYNKRSSRATTSLKKIKKLLSAVCAASPDSCSAITQYEMANQQVQTNQKLSDLIELIDAQEKKKETSELKETLLRINTLEAIQSFPSRIFKGLLK